MTRRQTDTTSKYEHIRCTSLISMKFTLNQMLHNTKAWMKAMARKRHRSVFKLASECALAIAAYVICASSVCSLSDVCFNYNVRLLEHIYSSSPKWNI